MNLIFISNYWVQKRSRSLADGKWSLFVWGFQSSSMYKALETASRKGVGEFKLEKHTENHWTACDPETDTRYVVEKRDTMPDLPSEMSFSVRDQTLPPNSEMKKMPEPKSLFK